MTAIADTRVLAFDCQSTGATPAQGQVIEAGWAVVDATTLDPEVESDLVALPEGRRLPRVVRELTGLRNEDFEGAASAEQVFCRLADRAAALGDPPARTIIHFATFERRFLEDWASRFSAAASPFDIVCTHDIAKRLLPDLPRRGLRALAGYYGFSATALRRSADHVAATCFVWRHLVPALAARGVTTWEDLEAWRAQAAPKRAKKKRYPMPRDKRLGLPDVPGVYRFKRTNGDVLYVGKATSLKKRVNSHFTKQAGLSDRVLEMLSQARDLEATPCETPLEAALLETDEIKALEPPYNVALLEERRSLAFASRDLAQIREAADSEHCIGPLGSPFAVAALPTVRRLLAAPESAAEASSFTGARALGIMPSSAPEQDILQEGLVRFAAANQLVLGAEPSVGALVGLGRRLFEARVMNARPRRDEEAVVWDPERVHEHLEIALARVAQHVQRARWLRRLADASVAFREPDAAVGDERLLVLRGGVVVQRGFVPLGATLPSDAVAGATPFDLARYDRLRVLLTELKRVLRDGGRVRVRFGACAELSGGPLCRALTIV